MLINSLAWLFGGLQSVGVAGIIIVMVGRMVMVMVIMVIMIDRIVTIMIIIDTVKIYNHSHQIIVINNIYRRLLKYNKQIKNTHKHIKINN